MHWALSPVTDHCCALRTLLFLHELSGIISSRNKLINLFLRSPCLWGHGACDSSSADALYLARESAEENSGVTVARSYQ